MCTVEVRSYTQAEVIYRLLSVLNFLYITTRVNANRFLKVFALKYAHKKRIDSTNMEGKARKKKKIAFLYLADVCGVFGFFFFLLFKPSEAHIGDQNSYWKQEHLPSTTLMRHTACFLL